METAVRRPSVLVVDDRRENLLAVRGALADLPAEVETVESGQEALTRLQAREFSAAVIDVQMPGMDGFELAGLMRASSRTRHVPIVLVTAGELASESVSRGCAMGAIDYVLEPLDGAVLRSKVRVLVELAEQRLRLEAALRERDLATAELRRALQEKSDAEAQLARIVDAAPVGIALLDPQLRYVRVNAALAAMNGLHPEVHPGRRVDELLPGLPTEQILRLWRGVLESGEPYVLHPVTGTTPAAPDRISHWRESAYRVRDGDRTLGLAVLIEDVSEEKRAAELQDLLLGIVSHDLRTPLSTLVNTLELLSRPELPPEKRAPAAARGRTAAHRMSRLIRDLLDYTRVRGGAGLQLQLLPVSIAEVVRASVEEQRNAHPAAELQVRPGAECSGQWDRERLRQVLENLLSNAVKHGAPGRPVQIGWEVAAGTVRVFVTNEGPEIPAAAVPTLFEPLTCARDGGGGIGLGLFIARAIVQAHGGRIGVSSGGATTTFSVELPLEEPRAC